MANCRQSRLHSGDPFADVPRMSGLGKATEENRIMRARACGYIGAGGWVWLGAEAKDGRRRRCVA